MYSVGAEGERRLDVVVDDERDVRSPRRLGHPAASLDDLGGRQVLEAKLDHGRSAFGGMCGGRSVLDDAVKPHASEMFARWSSDSGVSAYSPSYRRAWKV